jgi:Undecaprenyl-phosphate glucose phosphotransferase
MKLRDSELLIIYLIIDLIILNFSILLMACLSKEISVYNSNDLSVYILKGNLAWIIAYFTFSKKNLYLRDGFTNRILRITKRTLIFLAVSATITFFLMPQRFSRIFFIEYTFIFYVTQLISYWVFYLYLQYNRERGTHINRVFIIGINKNNQLLRQIIDKNPILGYHFAGYISSNKSDDIEVLGTLEELPELVGIHRVQTIFASIPVPYHPNTEKHYLNLCNQLGVRLRFIPENQRWHSSDINLESIGKIVVINPQEIPLDNLASRIWKRWFDIIFSMLFFLLIFFWLLPIIAILIKLSSKGPVFFVQKRTGFNNRIFNCYKFRSMQVNDCADEKQATENDTRITKMGHFLRRTNLDELPQFINVFLGQMSVVGPRPHMLKHTEQYSELIKYYLVRHYVKPGVTGWAQVNGLRGKTDELWKMQKRVMYDMEYIENWTFWWDIKIILMTIWGKEAFKNAL